MLNPLDRLASLENRLQRARADLLALEVEVAQLRHELGTAHKMPVPKVSERKIPAPAPKPPEKLLMTLQQFSEANPAFTVPALRWMRTQSQNPAEPDTFRNAFIKLGHRLLIDPAEFFRAVEVHRGE